MKVINILILILLIYETFLDVKSMKVNIIPMGFVSVIGIVINLSFDCISYKEIIFGALVGLCLLLISAITRQRIGYGDAILFMTIGVCLGDFKCLCIIWISMVIAALFGAIKMIMSKSGWHIRLPYTPFITVSFLIGELLWI